MGCAATLWPGGGLCSRHGGGWRGHLKPSGVPYCGCPHFDLVFCSFLIFCIFLKLLMCHMVNSGQKSHIFMVFCHQRSSPHIHSYRLLDKIFYCFAFFFSVKQDLGYQKLGTLAVKGASAYLHPTVAIPTTYIWVSPCVVGHFTRTAPDANQTLYCLTVRPVQYLRGQLFLG